MQTAAIEDCIGVGRRLGPDRLARTLFPVGHLTKAQVRQRAAALGLRTAGKPLTFCQLRDAPPVERR